MAREAVEVSQELVWAKSNPDKIEHILKYQASRLVKEDIIKVLAELQRQERWELVLKVCRIFFCAALLPSKVLFTSIIPS